MPTITTTTLAEYLIRGDRAALRAHLPALQAALTRALEVADQCVDEFMARNMLWHLGMTLHWSDYRDAGAPETLAPDDRTRPAPLPREEDPVSIKLCETAAIVMRGDRLYRVVTDLACPACVEMARRAGDLPPGGVLATFDDEPSDGKVQDESQDGSTRPAAPPPHTQMHRIGGTAFVAKGAVPAQAAAAAIAAATRKGG